MGICYNSKYLKNIFYASCFDLIAFYIIFVLLLYIWKGKFSKKMVNWTKQSLWTNENILYFWSNILAFKLLENKFKQNMKNIKLLLDFLIFKKEILYLLKHFIFFLHNLLLAGFFLLKKLSNQTFLSILKVIKWNTSWVIFSIKTIISTFAS